MNGVPEIEAELRQVGEVYVETKGANEGELRALALEAVKLGMAPEAVAT